MYFTVNSSDVMVQGAAVVWATQSVKQNANARVLYAKPQQMLQGLVKNGATVEVCALYLPNKGLKPDALIQGVNPGKPADVASYMLKSDMRMLAF